MQNASLPLIQCAITTTLVAKLMTNLGISPTTLDEVTLVALVAAVVVIVAATFVHLLPAHKRAISAVITVALAAGIGGVAHIGFGSPEPEATVARTAAVALGLAAIGTIMSAL
jgi:hypothetical protein